MKFTTTASQNGFFHHQGWIFFEGFFAPEEIKAMKDEIGASTKSHDLWRDFPKIKKIITKEIAPTLLSLNNKKTIRLAFDHYFHTSKAENRKKSKRFSDPELFIEDIFSIQGLTAGAIIPLTDGVKRTSHIENQSPFTWKRGDLFLFSSELPMIFSELVYEKNFSFLLIGFGGVSLVFKHNPKDPTAKKLQEMGYSPGDRLLENTHPCIHNKVF